MIKIVGLVRRREELTDEQFRQRWDEHVSVALELPNLRKYTRSLPVDPEACPYDGVAELYFDSAEECRAAFDTAAGDRQFEDAARFIMLPDDDDSLEVVKADLLSMMFEVRTEFEEPDG